MTTDDQVTEKEFPPRPKAAVAAVSRGRYTHTPERPLQDMHMHMHMHMCMHMSFI